MDKELAGIAALYAVIELVKWFSAKKDKDCQHKINDLWDWHNVTDDEGRRMMYVPKHLHIEQEKMVEMLRDLSRNMETTARLLGELLKKIELK